jgi:outer membrane protein TolC
VQKSTWTGHRAGHNLSAQKFKMPVALAETLTVERAGSIALQHNPDLLAARQGLETARASVVKAH